MKKLLSVIIILFAILTLSSCKKHEYKDTYSSDEAYHFKLCESCGKMKKKKKHSFKNGVCTVCSTTDGVIYELSTDGSFAIVAGYAGDSLTLKIADEYKGAPVTEIAGGAFSNNQTFTEIIMPDSITRINSAAFDDMFLSKVQLSENITQLSGYEFAESSRLEYNEYGNACYLGTENNPYFALVKTKNDSVTSCEIHKDTKIIMSMAFTSCTELEKLTLPDGIRIITSPIISDSHKLKLNEYDNAYYLGSDANPYLALVKAKNNTIKSCNIHENTKIILPNAFADCSELLSLNIPDSVTYIGERAFSECRSMVEIRLSKNINAINPYTFLGCKALKSISVPSGVTKIDHRAFESCSALTSFTFPDGVTYIGSDVFGEYNNISELYIPENVNYIGFIYGLTHTNVKYNEYDNAYYLGNEKNPYAILVKANDKSINTCEIHENTKYILYQAFFECAELKSIVIPESVRVIGEGAFAKCTSLKSVKINGRISALNKSTFSSCSSLEEIVLPDSISHIEPFAFADCSSLTQIAIPEGVVYVGGSALSNTDSLTHISLPNSLKSFDLYLGEYSNLELTEYAGAYYLGNSSNPYLALVKAKDKSIKECTVNGQTRIILGSAFANCTELTSIAVPDNVERMFPNVFGNCAALRSVTLGNGITRIPDRAFSRCVSLKTLSLPDNLSTIGKRAFQGCSSLATLELPKTLQAIYSEAFLDCSSLEKINLPENLKTLGGMTFYNCTSLKSITVPSGVNTLAYDFVGCTALETVILCEGLEAIEGSSFGNCQSLKSVVIPSSVTQISTSSFSKCPSLKDIYYIGTEEEWSKIDTPINQDGVTVHFNYNPD